MKKIIVAVVSLLYFMMPAAGHGAEQLDASQAINLAGSQRMLSQRIVKAYCQIGLNEVYGEPQRQIKESIAFFESNMTNLAPFIKEGGTAQVAAEMRQYWADYKVLATGTPSKENARKLYEVSEELLAASQKMVDAIQSPTGVKTGALVSMAGRQRMLSQRMAMFHMLKIWGISDEATEKKAQTAHNEFVAAQSQLLKEPRNTPAISKNLEMVANSLKLLDHSLKSHEGLTYTVATTSEKMLKTMDEVTRAYTALEQPVAK